MESVDPLFQSHNDSSCTSVCLGKLPNVEIRKLGSKGLVQEVSVQKEQSHLGISDTTEFDGDSLRNARRNLDSAFNLDSAEGHTERSDGADSSLNLYAYGVRISSVVHCFDALVL